MEIIIKLESFKELEPDTNNTTITVNKKSLFSALESDEQGSNDEVSIVGGDITPRQPKAPTKAPSPIPFEADLNITPPGQCSSPIESILPGSINLEHVDHVPLKTNSEDDIENTSIRVLKHVNDSLDQPSAKSISFPVSHYIHQQSIAKLPSKMSPPVKDENAITLNRSISFGSPGTKTVLWASKRGELIYTAGSILVVEKIEDFSQKIINSPTFNSGEITATALSNDERNLAVFHFSDQEFHSVTGYIYNCETLEKVPLSTGHKETVFASEWSQDSRHILSLSGTYKTTIELNASWDGALRTNVEVPYIINDIAWIGNTEFISVSHEIIKWSLEQNASGRFGLRSTRINLVNELSNEFYTCMHVNDFRMVVGTSSGKCLYFNLELTNFELEYLFNVSDGVEVSAIGINGNNRIVTSVDNSVKFWSFISGDTLKTRLFQVEEEFEIDGAATKIIVDDEVAVVATLVGSVVFLATDTLRPVFRYFH